MPVPDYLTVLRLVAGGLAALGAWSAWKARGGAAPALVGVAAAVAAGGWRATQVGHLPFAGLHETLLTFGVCLSFVAALAAVTAGAWRVYGLSTVLAGALVALASIAPARPTPLVPALQTLWFELHVGSSFVAYACFALSGAAGAVELLRAGGGQERPLLETANRWGFAWFTWAMVSGGVWAYLAWGAYWLWHVKELWSALLWTFYAGVVHLPHTPGWRGRRQAALSVGGFGLVLVTYLGVGLLMRNTHQF